MKNSKQLSQLNSKISDLEIIVFSQKSANDNLISKVEFLTQEKEYLEQRVKLLTAALYGKKSEKLKDEDIQDAKQEILPGLFK